VEHVCEVVNCLLLIDVGSMPSSMQNLYMGLNLGKRNVRGM